MNLTFLFRFISIFLFEITKGKGIGIIYKYDLLNCPYLSPNTAYVIWQRSENSIQTQRLTDSDASVVAHALASSGLDQSTNHHGNTDFNNNNDSQSFERPR